MLEKSDKRKMIKYFVLTYVLFWVLIASIGLLISLDVPVLVQDIMKNVAAWAPTFALLILFKLLYPNTTLKGFLKKNFSGKVTFKSFLVPFLVMLLLTVLAVVMHMLISGTTFANLEFISLAGIIPLFIITLTSGATGEELGWRGYALNKLQEKHTPLRASIIVGILWAFWHLPLWLVSGYVGLELLYYMGAFLLAIISFSIIITFFYNKSKNILVAMWLHFLFNFFIAIVIIDVLTILIYLAFTYFIFTVILVIVKREYFLNKPQVPIEAEAVNK